MDKRTVELVEEMLAQERQRVVDEIVKTLGVIDQNNSADGVGTSIEEIADIIRRKWGTK